MIRRAIRIAACASLLFAQPLSNCFAAAAKENPPNLPQYAKSITGLVAKPWRIISTADGDLNDDDKQDGAVVAVYEDAKQGVSVSRLIVALRDAHSGMLHVAEESDTATMVACGPAGSPPHLSIKKGVLLLHQECGSKTHYSFTYKYQLRKEKWLLIGYEAQKYDSMAPAASSTIDVNFVTGEVAAALYEENKPKVSERFLEVRAPRIITTGPGITDWAVPRIVIRPLTKSASAIATQAVYNNKHLFIRVQYDPPSKLTPFKVSLADSHGKTVPFVDSAVTPYGYILQSYDLATPQMKAAIVPTQDWVSQADVLMHLTLEVQPDETAPAAVRTSRKSAGAVLLSGSHEPIALDNINIEQDPMPHPFIFKVPTE
jgi:hypothetical protein